MSKDESVLEGLVIEGARLGRTLGFPTANIDASEDRSSNDVYLVGVEHGSS